MDTCVFEQKSLIFVGYYLLHYICVGPGSKYLPDNPLFSNWMVNGFLQILRYSCNSSPEWFYSVRCTINSQRHKHLATIIIQFTLDGLIISTNSTDCVFLCRRYIGSFFKLALFHGPVLLIILSYSKMYWLCCVLGYARVKENLFQELALSDMLVLGWVSSAAVRFRAHFNGCVFERKCSRFYCDWLIFYSSTLNCISENALENAQECFSSAFAAFRVGLRF